MWSATRIDDRANSAVYNALWITLSQANKTIICSEYYTTTTDAIASKNWNNKLKITAPWIQYWQHWLTLPYSSRCFRQTDRQTEKRGQRQESKCSFNAKFKVYRKDRKNVTPWTDSTFNRITFILSFAFF